MENKSWGTVITSKQFSLNFKELIRSKDLIMLLVRRDFVTIYKQTILGPLWILIQPLLTTITYLVVFTGIAGIETGVPPILFYLLGVCIWFYFADVVLKTSETFVANQAIFGKVYFPRLVVPFSIVLTNLFKFGVQFSIFIVFYIYYYFQSPLHFNHYLFLIPVLLIVMISLGLGIGLIIAGLTSKYRDLRFFIQFGIQLLMFASPVVYPLKSVPEDARIYILANPMTSIIECFKLGFFGSDNAVFEWYHLIYSLISSFIVLIVGMWLFSRVEKSFIDTI